MEREAYQSLVEKAQRIVVKVGTSTLTHSTGKLNLEHIEHLVRQLTDLRYQGKEVELVSSGAIGAGMGKMNLDKRPKTIPEKQAVAAIGQGILMQLYEKLFSEYGQTVAQLLLTKSDMDDRRRFLNARNTLVTLLQLGVIPIINENDTVAVEEIRFGDNDTLAALVATLVDADLLILLSDIDGLYTADPRKHPDAELIGVVPAIDASVEGAAGDVGSKFGSGGMATKIGAAKIATNAGIPMLIANGAEDGIVRRLIHGESLGTLFLARELKPHLRKSWIAFGSKVEGAITVDDGAKTALIEKGKSLLPSGIIAVSGNFHSGEVVSILDSQGREFARGITNYDQVELSRIKGVKCKDICGILGYKDYDEAIHRDNLSLRL